MGFHKLILLSNRLLGFGCGFDPVLGAPGSIENNWFILELGAERSKEGRGPSIAGGGGGGLRPTEMYNQSFNIMNYMIFKTNHC